jgi:hypothetical protein
MLRKKGAATEERRRDQKPKNGLSRVRFFSVTPYPDRAQSSLQTTASEHQTKNRLSFFYLQKIERKTKPPFLIAP